MSAFLLDTHTLLWFVEGNIQIKPSTRTIITNINNQCYISVTSIWELAIKSSSGKLSLGLPIDNFIEQHILGNGFAILDIMTSHAVEVAKLPWHHRDPFDRMLIAQAMVENIPLLSADQIFDAYTSIQRIW